MNWKFFVKRMVRPDKVKPGTYIHIGNNEFGTIERVEKGNDNTRYDWSFHIFYMKGTETWVHYIYCDNDSYIEIVDGFN